MLAKYGYCMKKDAYEQTSYKLLFVSQVLTAFFYLTIFYYISKVIGKDAIQNMIGTDYFSFAFMGISLYGILTVGLNVFAKNVRSAQNSGVLEYTLSTASSPLEIVFGLSISGFCRALILFIVYGTVAVTFFHLKFNLAQLIPAIVILLLTIIAVSCLGIMAAGLAMFFKQNFTYWISAFLAICSGAFFPVSVLPKYIQFLAYLSPLTYSLDAMRGLLFQGQNISSIVPQTLALIVFIVIFLPLSVMIFSYLMKLAMKAGNLNEY